MKMKNDILRFVPLILFLGLTLVLSGGMKFNDSLQNWVPENSEIMNNYRSFLAEFKTDALIIVAITGSDKKNDDDLKKSIDEIKQKIRRLPHVLTVINWPPPFLRYKVKLNPDIQSFFLTYSPPSHNNPNRPDLIKNITDCLDTAGLQYHLAGTGVVHKAINDMTKSASRQFLTIGMIILLLFLILLLRNTRIILKTIGISLGGVACILFTACLLKIKFNMGMSVLPVLILFYGTSISVHILNHGGDYKRIFWPTLTAVLTTCAGFAVFLAESIPLLRDFGLLAISGLIGGFLWATLLFYQKKNTNLTSLPYREKLHSFQNLWNFKSMIVGFFLFIILVPGAMRIKSEINTYSILPKNHPVIKDYQYIREHAGSCLPIEYLVDIKNDPEDVRNWIENVYRLDKVEAVMSYLAIPGWINPGQSGYVSKDGKSGRITFFVPMQSTTEGLSLADQIDALADKCFQNPEDKPRPTGFLSLYVSVSDHLSQSFRKSLILAFILVFLIILLFVRNAVLFAAAILPNLFPIIAILGIMGWFHIPLDMVTVPIGCLALGIIVDDTIHFLYWFKKTNHVEPAFKEAGPGIVVTSIIAVLGFSVFLFAQAPPVRYFGILSITAMITAFLGDIVILPIILQWLERSGKFKGRKR